MKPWKIACIGIALVTGTALASSATTAYLVRARSPEPGIRSTPSAQSNPTVARVAPSARVAPRAVQTVPSTSYVRPAAVAASSVPANCASTADRVWRVAKPGLLGGLLGAGVGAAGGAIADGGQGAGKGALIGTLAGAAAGGVYGAYKTKNECGTVLGESNVFNGSPAGAPQQAVLTSAPSNGVTVYPAR